MKADRDAINKSRVKKLPEFTGLLAGEKKSFLH